MEQTIIQMLNHIEKEHDVKIILASESGSRAWGFPSSDSDYDVRFIYAHQTDWYLSIGNKKDVIELPVDKVLDVNGWDLKKALQLMRKSNSPLLEWLGSPIKYKILPDAHEKLLSLSKQAFMPETACWHYLSMARKSFEGLTKDGKARLKPYLYTLRALLCCEWIIRHLSQPPMRICDVMTGLVIDDNIIEEINHLIQMKKMHSEKYKMEKSNILHNYITGRIDRLHHQIPINPQKLELKMFDGVFRNILSEINA
jgi:uncharacterized protein